MDANTVTTFELIPSEFLRRAQASPPENPQPTASAFSQWIYSLYGRASGSKEDREAGRTVEKSVWDRRKDTFGCNDNAFLRRTGSDWTLVHNGLQIDDAEKSEYFSVKSLVVNKEPLRASPDLIYINGKTSEALIVEIKYSRLLITSNLWPNVWAQLWCYSQIDIVSNARKTTVVGEVWGELEASGDRFESGATGGELEASGDRLELRATAEIMNRKGKLVMRPTVKVRDMRPTVKVRDRSYPDGESPLCLRASVRRNPRAPAYDRFFRRLFEIYCGEG